MNYDEARKLKLKIGDKVVIRFDNTMLYATIIHEPQGEGDCWQFIDGENNPFILNIYSSRVFMISKRIEHDT